MIQDQAYILAVKAAEPTRERIRQDCRKASAQLVPMLGKIENHLLDPDLSVKALLRWCRVRDKNVSARFAQDLGMTLWAYITERRMEVAARLLEDSDLQSYSIGMVLRYSSAQAFSRAFRRWAGTSPHQYRVAHGAGGGKPGGDGDGPDPDDGASVGPLSSPGALLDPEEMRRALSGELDGRDAVALLRAVETFGDRLRAAYPELRPHAAAPAPVVGAELVESSMAQAVWTKLDGLPFDEQQDLVRAQVAFRTPALYRLLCGKSLKLANQDGRRALEVAELALASVGSVAGHAERWVVGNMNAQAWALIGWARYVIEDFKGADEAYDVALRTLTTLGEEMDVWILMEISLFRACYALQMRALEQANGMLKLVIFILENPDPKRYREERARKARERLAGSKDGAGTPASRP